MGCLFLWPKATRFVSTSSLTVKLLQCAIPLASCLRPAKETLQCSARVRPLSSITEAGIHRGWDGDIYKLQGQRRLLCAALFPAVESDLVIWTCFIMSYEVYGNLKGRQKYKWSDKLLMLWSMWGSWIFFKHYTFEKQSFIAFDHINLLIICQHGALCCLVE